MCEWFTVGKDLTWRWLQYLSKDDDDEICGGRQEKKEGNDGDEGMSSHDMNIEKGMKSWLFS